MRTFHGLAAGYIETEWYTSVHNFPLLHNLITTRPAYWRHLNYGGHHRARVQRGPYAKLPLQDSTRLRQSRCLEYTYLAKCHFTTSPLNDRYCATFDLLLRNLSSKKTSAYELTQNSLPQSAKGHLVS
jgi:hypothetical protein